MPDDDAATVAKSVHTSSKPSTPTEDHTLSTSKTSPTTSTSDLPKKSSIDHLAAQASRLKLFTDPLGLHIPKTRAVQKTTNTPVTQPTPTQDFMGSDPFPAYNPDPFPLFPSTYATTPTTPLENNNPFSPPIDATALSLYVDTGEIPGDKGSRRGSAVDRRLSKEWDASKVPPSRFQRPEGSIFATQGSRDGHVDRNVQQRYMEKLKEKGWDK